MNSAELLVQKFRRYPFWSQLLITLGSLVVLIAIWTACGVSPPAPPASLAAPRTELHSHYGAVFALAFSPTGTWLASGTSDKMARLWHVAKGEVIQTMKGHGDVITSLAVSPDGKILATCSADKTVKLWDTSKGIEIRTLAGHTARVSGVAFSPKGHQLASASEDGTVRLWDVPLGEQLHVLEGHSGKVNAITFSPDGRLLASAGDDKTVRLWDSEKGKLVRILDENHSRIISVAFSPDGKLLASGSVTSFGLGINPPAEIRLWNPATGNLEYSLHHPGEVRRLVFRPGSNVLASATDLFDVSEIANWDTETKTIISRWNAHRNALYALAYSPDGLWLASGGDDGRIRLWQ